MGNISLANKDWTPTRIFDLELQKSIKVQLYEYNQVSILDGSPVHKKILQDDLDSARKSDSNCIRRNIPTACYNCHGLTFASRRGWLNDADLIIKFEGYSYRELSNNDKILAGDVICYYKGGSISHSGIVVDGNSYLYNEIITSKSSVKILSKWGAMGEFIHDHDKSPYGVVFKILRYNRSFY